MRRSSCLLVLTGLCATLAACGNHSQHDMQVIVIGDAAAPFVTRGRLPLAAQLVRGATTEGLVALDTQARITPALADRWIVTDDGRSYIFRLRDGTWPDGQAITGENARVALHQALAALQHSAMALDLDVIEDVRAMAGRVVEIRLRQPMPDFLQLLAQPELGLSHHGRGSGPMALHRTGNVALLTPIPPDKRGAPAMAGWADNVHRLVLRSAPGGDAVAAFANGHADIVLGGTFANLPRTTALGNARRHIDPVIGLFGLGVTHTTGLLADPALREALAMAIDRDALAASLALPNWTTTTRVVPPGVLDDTGQIDERWLGVGMADRRTAAARRVAAWAAHSHQPAALRIALPQGPGADLLFNRLAQDMALIGVGVTRAGPDAPADLRLIDVVARYPGEAWFLDALGCVDARFVCSPAADGWVARARAASDMAAASNFYAQAEAVLTQDNIYIPIGVPIRWSLVAGDNPGFAVNRWGVHPLAALAGAQ